jgi:hypothetical protein
MALVSSHKHLKLEEEVLSMGHIQNMVGQSSSCRVTALLGIPDS